MNRLGNINEKKYLKRVGNMTDMFWSIHFTEHLRRIRRAYMNIQNH